LHLNYGMGTWRGIALPKGTSPDIVAVYEKAVAVYEKAVDKIVKSRQFVNFMNHGSFTILYKGSADKFLAEQDKLMGVLTREAGITK
jgi:tripartite-type tricarboxylate transporter receptor subunit TctC